MLATWLHRRLHLEGSGCGSAARIGAFVLGSVGSVAARVGSVGSVAARVGSVAARRRSAAGDGGGEGAHARAILVPVGKGRGAVVSTRMQLEGQSSAMRGVVESRHVAP